MKKKDKICIITVGYNRPNAMKRLLNSLEEADYNSEEVDLLISIDKGEKQQQIVQISNDYNWPHGTKRIRAFSERQGLRRHIIQCGDLTEEYKAVVVLEDDISVSNVFYYYVSEAVKFYCNDEHIAGISLYKHQTNVGVSRFFEPEYDGHDVFLMQFAQSWGECWTTRMWRDFKKWYIENENKFFSSNNSQLLNKIPNNIKHWGNQSWMKYYMAYIVERNLFYVYPYHALSTNHCEVGQHNSFMSYDYQIALATGKKHYSFPKFEEAVKYDMFFERLDYAVTNYENKQVIFDLYGNKVDFSNADMLVSSQKLPYKVIKRMGLYYRPHELNCKYQEEGTGLFLYDLSVRADKPSINTDFVRTRYDVRATNWRSLLWLGLIEFREACLRKVFRK